MTFSGNGGPHVSPTFAGTVYGGAICIRNGTGTLTLNNVTFSDNTALNDDGGAIAVFTTGSVVISNSIFWGDTVNPVSTNPEIVSSSGTVTISSSIIYKAGVLPVPVRYACCRLIRCRRIAGQRRPHANTYADGGRLRDQLRLQPVLRGDGPARVPRPQGVNCDIGVVEVVFDRIYRGQLRWATDVVVGGSSRKWITANCVPCPHLFRETESEKETESVDLRKLKGTLTPLSDLFPPCIHPLFIALARRSQMADTRPDRMPSEGGLRLSVKPSLFAELRRRNVFRAGAFYIAATWALAQGIAQLAPVVGAPEWAARWFLIAAAIGFPFWIGLAWFYEFTPEGLKRESEIDPAQSIAAHTGKKLDRWIIAIMAIAIVLLLTNTFVWHKGAGLSADDDSVPVTEQSIAVLPFVNMSSDKEQEYFSDGISEELLNLLAKVPQLVGHRAHRRRFAFKGQALGIPEVARKLHVAHVLEGSVRKAGDAVRITAQLIDAASATSTYGRRPTTAKLDDIFAIQDEIKLPIVVKHLQLTLLGARRRRRVQPIPRPIACICAGATSSSAPTRRDGQEHRLFPAVAIARAPDYAMAHAGLADAYATQAFLRANSRKAEVVQERRARRSTARSELEPDLGEAHASLGQILFLFEWDLGRRRRRVPPRALRSPPGSEAVHENYGGISQRDWPPRRGTRAEP